MKWGTKFSPEYVNLLAAMVRKNLTVPHRFVCFTENAEGLDSRIEVRPLPEMNLDARLPERGWRKLTVFQDRLDDLVGQALFIDLDVLIWDNLDCFFELDGAFRIIQDWNLPGRRASLGKTLGKIEGWQRRVRQRMRRLDDITG